MRRSYWIILFLALTTFAAVMLADWWKHRHLITLDVKDAEILPVLKEVARQSGVPVLASTNTTGKVTVHFERVTLDHALNVLAEQTDGRWQPLFLLGRDNDALRSLERNVAAHGPPFLLTARGGGGEDGMAAMFQPDVGAATNVPARLEFNFSNKELQTASLEMALRMRTPIMVQESFNPGVTLQLAGEKPMTAVAKLAGAASGRSEFACHFRVSRWSGFVDGGGGEGRGRRGNREGGDGSGPQASSAGGGDSAREARASRREERQKMMEAQIAMLPAEDRERYEQAREEQRKRREEFRNLTPEERQQRMTEMANNAKAQQRFDNRALSRIKNLTPEQRVQRYQRFARAHGPQAPAQSSPPPAPPPSPQGQTPGK